MPDDYKQLIERLEWLRGEANVMFQKEIAATLDETIESLERDAAVLGALLSEDAIIEAAGELTGYVIRSEDRGMVGRKCVQAALQHAQEQVKK